MPKTSGYFFPRLTPRLILLPSALLICTATSPHFPALQATQKHPTKASSKPFKWRGTKNFRTAHRASSTDCASATTERQTFAPDCLWMLTNVLHSGDNSGYVPTYFVFRTQEQPCPCGSNLSRAKLARARQFMPCPIFLRSPSDPKPIQTTNYF